MSNLDIEVKRALEKFSKFKRRELVARLAISDVATHPDNIALRILLGEMDEQTISRRHKQAVFIAGLSAVISIGAMVASFLSANEARRQADAADRSAQQSIAHTSPPQPQVHLPSSPPKEVGEPSPSTSQ